MPTLLTKIEGLPDAGDGTGEVSLELVDAVSGFVDLHVSDVSSWAVARLTPRQAMGLAVALAAWAERANPRTGG